MTSAQVMDTITYPLDRASQPGIIGIQGGSGFITGTNSFDVQGQTIGTYAVGNYYNFGKGKIIGAYVWFGTKETVGSPNSYAAKVSTAQQDTTPGTTLDQSSPISISNIDTPRAFQTFDTLTYFDFPNNPQHSGRFIVSVEVDGPSKDDTLAVIANDNGAGEERSLQQLSFGGGTWFRMTNIWQNWDRDLMIFPVVEREFFANVTADKTEVCPGEAVQLSANVTGGSGSYSYNWTPGGSTPSSQSTTVQISQGLNTTKTFEVQVIDNNSQDTTTQSVDVDVFGIDVNVTPSDTSIACGDSIDLSATSTGYTQGVNFDWNNNVTGAINANVKDGQFKVTASNGKGCSSTASTNVSVQGVSQSLSFEYPDTVCVGQSVQFTNTSTFTSDWTFTWTVEGQEVGGKNLNFSFSSAGNKTVKLKGDSAGCALSPVQESFNVKDSTSSACITGISSNKSFDGQFDLYPNPASEKLSISVQTASDKDVTLELVNIQGEKVYSEYLGNIDGSFDKTIDVSNLTNGVYIIKLQDGQNIATDKFTLSK